VPSEFIESLTARIDEVTRKASEEFGSLTASQLNWKPSEKNWSIAQCLDHIIVSNETYFPQLETVIDGRWRNSFRQNLPLLPKLWGKMILNGVSPDSKRKSKTFKVFEPASSGIPVTILKEFASHNQTLKGFMEKSSRANLDRIVLSSPASTMIIYSLRNTFLILTAHEERHFLQAKRVKDTQGFPS
jgi:hypothetical protein